MIEVNQLRKGVTYILDNNIWKVLEYAHNKTGRGGATISTKDYNLRTGAIVEHTFNSGAKVADIRIESLNVQFTYADDTFAHFMDMETYEEIILNRTKVSESIGYLKEGVVCTLEVYGKEPLNLELPTTVELIIKEADVAIRGDTSGSVTKSVRLETGKQINVPAFVNVGDLIRIDTRTNSYITRV